MQQLLNEIDQVKNDAEASIKTLEKIDAERTKGVVDHDRLLQDRRQIYNLNEHIINLQKQMDAMTKESDSSWPIKTFDKTKQKAFETLSNLSKQLNQVDERLERVINSNVQPVASLTTTIDNGNTKGIDNLVNNLPFNQNKTSESNATARVSTPSLSSSDDESISDEDEDEEESKIDNRDAWKNGKQEPLTSTPLLQKIAISSDEHLDTDDENDEINDKHQFVNELHNQQRINENSQDSNEYSQSPQTSSSSSSSSTPRKPTTPLRKSANTSESDSYSEEDNDQDNDGEYSRSSDDSEEEEDEHTVVNANIQELRMRKYLPGTQFRVLHNFNAIETSDLTLHKDEILILVKQQDDDWWLFKNPQTQQEGMVPINHIQLQSKTYKQSSRSRIQPLTSASILVDAFKTNNYIPSGFIPSDLAPLTQQNQYKLSFMLIPQMTESNFAFADLYWQDDTDQISIQDTEYQKILKIKKCLKIPKIKGSQIRVLGRCIRICLYDGFTIISNIHSTRARLSGKSNANDLTEDWYFAPNKKNTIIDQQCQFLIRSDEYDRSKHLYLLIELSQLCQSKVNDEKCEIGCGWIMISIDNYEKNNYNKRLHGGHFYETNILLNSQYKNFHSQGLAGKIDRYKQARIQFSLESREEHNDLLYNSLPLKSMIVPINLVEILVFYRNELAYQLQKRYHSNSFSTVPLDSIFLSTFYQTLEQPDLIYLLQRLYHRNKKLSNQEQREEFIKIYELSIYPLLFYRLLPSYDFHNLPLLHQRKQLLIDMLAKLKKEKKDQPDILAILLDPNLTDKWAPFTTNEICFSLQKIC
ncbi:unnamed protein product [Adineta steineri]|uniref:SH3 domain-containing protein n=4 Tax=Adineta steineri TaxID=433720 RepID=A0A815LI82_9BILA|nr:unnamed protein product [Adineta steineri]